MAVVPQSGMKARSLIRHLLLSGVAFACTKLSAATGTIQDVQHVVVFVQENRSFDNYFGTLKGVRGFGDRNSLVLQNGSNVLAQPNGPGFMFPFHSSAQCQEDVDHHWEEEHQAWDSGRWDQWVPAKGAGTMVYYTRSDLPFYYALAEAYTVCDEFHCSVMGPTYPNRLYLMTGTSDPNGTGGGPVTYNFIPPNGFTWTTYPERLQAAGISWRIYQQNSDYFNLNTVGWFSNYMHAAAGNPLYDRGLTLVPDIVDAFRRDVTNNTLPKVTWLIPRWSLSEHPPFAPANGEWFTRQFLDALASNPAVYKSTVFILTYDEGGGFFDHVQPPVPPPGTPNEFVGGLPIGLGARVPTIIVSPWTRGGYVCSEVFDHTSILRFLEKWTGVQEPNISVWRRQICGDLTSAFNFAAPDTNYPSLPATPLYSCTGTVSPIPPTPQTAPIQEDGTNRLRPRPYAANASARSDCTHGGLSITMTNGGTAVTPFAIYANAYRADGPWQYIVPPGTSRTAYFNIAAPGFYDFTCYGPHVFHRRFAGNLTNDCNQIDATLAASTTSGMHFTLQNSTPVPVTFTITNTTQSGSRFSYIVPPGTLSTNILVAFTNTSSYDVAAFISTDNSFLRTFADDVDSTAALVDLNGPDGNAVRLFLSAQSGIVTLRFPVSAANWTIESTADLSQDNWSALAPNLSTNGDQIIITVPAQSGARFFRLRQ
jgi:phospholipase C